MYIIYLHNVLYDHLNARPNAFNILSDLWKNRRTKTQ